MSLAGVAALNGDTTADLQPITEDIAVVGAATGTTSHTLLTIKPIK